MSATEIESRNVSVAGLRRRVGAMIYDGLLVVALWMVTMFVLVVVNGGNEVPASVTQPVAVFELFTFFAYFWLHRGQTLGMMAWRLRLVSSGTAPGPITPRQALLRFIGASLAFASAGIGYVWMWFDHERRTWPDMLSGTRVVFEART